MRAYGGYRLIVEQYVRLPADMHPPGGRKGIFCRWNYAANRRNAPRAAMPRPSK
jgi:hypothetical protein